MEEVLSEEFFNKRFNEFSEEERRKFTLYSERLSTIRELKTVDLEALSKECGVDKIIIENKMEEFRKDASKELDELFHINSN